MFAETIFDQSSGNDNITFLEFFVVHTLREEKIAKEKKCEITECSREIYEIWNQRIRIE